MDVCFVGYTRDGMISRAYEYFDAGQIEKFLGHASRGRSRSLKRGRTQQRRHLVTTLILGLLRA